MVDYQGRLNYSLSSLDSRFYQDFKVDLCKFADGKSPNEEILKQYFAGNFSKNNNIVTADSAFLNSWTRDTLGSTGEKKSLGEKISIILGFGIQIFVGGAEESNMMDIGDAVFYDLKGNYLLGLEKLTETYYQQKDLSQLCTEGNTFNEDQALVKSSNKTTELRGRWEIYSNGDNNTFLATYKKNLVVTGKYDGDNELIKNIEVIDDIFNESKLSKAVIQHKKWMDMSVLSSALIGGTTSAWKAILYAQTQDDKVYIIGSFALPLVTMLSTYWFGRALYKKSFTDRMSDNIKDYIFGFVKEND